MSSVLTLLLAILGISLLVIVHETGHYLAARAFGMRVLRFSIGFGPTLFKYQPKGSPTTFQVAAVPFLAYVQIAGMNPHEEVDTEDPEIFGNASLLGRIVTIFAGPFANYLLASVLVFATALISWPTGEALEPMTVGQVIEDRPAGAAGMEVGDVIVRANGQPVRNVTELQEITRPRAGEATVYLVQRDGEELEFTITPLDSDGVGVIGVAALAAPGEPLAIGAAAEKAIVFPFDFTMMQLRGLGSAIANADASSLAGPVRMTSVVAEAAGRGPLDYVRMLMALSIALGMFNLLPIPALDGGRLVFLGYELVTRQRANDRFEATVHMVGLLFLLGVIALVTLREVWPSDAPP